MFTNPHKKTNAAHTRQGFTLIELLVVIAIIALLAAILFPVFAQAREKARQTACLSNMNQVGKACFMYSQDFDEYEVPQSVAYGGGTTYWPTLLTPYINSTKTNLAKTAFSCPSAADSTALAVAPNPQYIRVGTGWDKDLYYGGATGGDYSSPAGSTTAGQLSYSLNCIYNDLSTTAGNPDGWKSTTWPLTAGKLSTPHFGFTKNTNSTTVSGHPVAVSEVEDPAGTIHIVDAMIGRNTSGNTHNLGASIGRITREGATDMNTDAEDAKPTYRHNGGFNALFGDGHAHWRKYGTTKPCEWSIQADICP